MRSIRTVRCTSRGGARAKAAALALTLAVALLADGGGAFAEGPAAWRLEFPKTDFDRRAVDYDEIVFDGATRDQIAPIYDPTFVPVAAAMGIGPLEPVLSLVVGGDARAIRCVSCYSTRSSTTSSAACRCSSPIVRCAIPASFSTGASTATC